MEFHMSKPSSLLDTLLAVPQDEDVSCVIMQMPPNLFGFGLPPEKANAFRKVMIRGFENMKKGGKPFALWRSSLDSQDEEWTTELESRGLPVFDSAERAVRALGAMNRYALRCQALSETA